MHYRHRRYHFNLHPLNRHNCLQSPSQSCCHITVPHMLGNIKHIDISGFAHSAAFTHNQLHHDLRDRHPVTVNLLSSILSLLAWSVRFVFKTSFHTLLIINPQNIMHKCTFTSKKSTSPFLTLNSWYLKSFASERVVC